METPDSEKTFEETPDAVREFFDPAFKEIARRNEAVKNFDDSDAVAHFPASGDTRIPFCIPDQDFFLLSLGTKVFAPIPLEHTRPSLRVYGVFSSKDEATSHADVIKELDANVSLMIVPRGTWVLMPQTLAARDDASENKRVLEQRLQAHRLRQADDGEGMRSAMKDGVERAKPRTKQQDPEERYVEEDAEVTVYPRPKRLRAGGEVRGQSTVALCIAPDFSGAGECLIKLLGCFETTAEADQWVRDVATRRITDDDVIVAQTCEWLYPNTTDDVTRASSEKYRVDELQKIMDATVRNEQSVKSYKKWKEEEDAKKEKRPATQVNITLPPLNA